MNMIYFIRNLGVGFASCTILATSGAVYSAPIARDVTNSLPGFIKQQEARNRGRSPCSAPLTLHWKVLHSPTSGPAIALEAPWAGAGTRAWGSTDINQLLTHTFDTSSVTRGCCFIPKEGHAWLGVNGQTNNPLDPFVGNLPNNDLFGTVGLGAMTPNPVSAAPFGTPYGDNWDNWGFKPVKAANVSSNNMFTYAIGDDIQIKQTRLYVQTCCIPKKSPVRNSASRRDNAVGNAFKQMLKKDGKRR